MLVIAASAAMIVNAKTLETLKVVPVQVANEVFSEGRVQAVHQSTVSAETSGRVQQILFDVGDSVAAGAVIVKLVGNEQQQGFNQAEAALMEAQATYDLQEKEFKRIEEVYNKKLVAKAEFDKAFGNFAAAKSRLASARAAKKTSEERLSYTVVKAPFAGVVSARYIEKGEAVQPGKALMSGFDPNALRVEAHLSVSQANMLKQYKKASIVANNQRITPSHIDIFPVVNEQSGSVTVRFELPTQEHALSPGAWVKVAISGEIKDKIMVPVSAIIRRSELSAVYVKTSAGPILRQVRLARSQDNQVQVLAGVSAGEVIYLDAMAAAISVAQEKVNMAQ